MKSAKLISIVASFAMAATIVTSFTMTASANGDAKTVWNYNYDGTAVGGAWGGNAVSSIAANPITSFGQSMCFDSSTHNKLTKTGQHFYGNFTLSFDFNVNSTATTTFYLNMFQNAGSVYQQFKTYSNGKIAGTNYFILAEEAYHVDWVTDVMKRTYAISVTGKIASSAGGTGTQMTITPFSGDLSSDYEYTSGLYIVGNGTFSSTSTLYLDNIKVVADAQTFTADKKTYTTSDTAVAVTTNDLFTAATKDSIVVKKDGTTLTAGTDYNITWNDIRTSSAYYGNPTINFTSAMTEGTYQIVFDGLTDSYSRAAAKTITYDVGDYTVTGTYLDAAKKNTAQYVGTSGDVADAFYYDAKTSASNPLETEQWSVTSGGETKYDTLRTLTPVVGGGTVRYGFAVGGAAAGCTAKVEFK